GECLIAHPGITGLDLPARRWPATSSVEAVVSAGWGERAVIISPGGAGPAGSARPDIPGADAVLSRAGRRLTPVRGSAYLSQRAAGRDWRGGRAGGSAG